MTKTNECKECGRTTAKWENNVCSGCDKQSRKNRYQQKKEAEIIEKGDWF